MRIIETKVYTFDELSEDVKKAAIESVRESYYEYNDFASWAAEGDYILNPPYTEIQEMFPTLKDSILIGRKEGNLYFSCDRNSYIDCADSIDIIDKEMFMLWLGIPKEMHESVYYTIKTPSYRSSSTIIEFEENDCEHRFTDEENDILSSATEKFKSHLNDCLESIESEIDYRFSDEAIIEDIESNEWEFTEEGKIY